MKVSYSTEDVAREAIAFMERTKVNPDVLRSFPCAVCGRWHIGTWFGHKGEK